MATHDHNVFLSLHDCLSNIFQMVTKIEATMEATLETQTEFTRSQVAAHNQPSDLWIIYRDKVYNLTPYYKIHPGGDALLNRAGKDATNILWTIVDHALSMSVVEGILDDCYIGELKS